MWVEYLVVNWLRWKCRRTSVENVIAPTRMRCRSTSSSSTMFETNCLTRSKFGSSMLPDESMMKTTSAGFGQISGPATVFSEVQTFEKIFWRDQHF